MGVKDTMKIGIVEHNYPRPPDLEGAARSEWFIEQGASLGLTTLHVNALKVKRDVLKHLGELAKSKGIELEYGAPWEIFQLTGDDAKSARETILEAMRDVQAIGTNLIRAGYGRLKLPTSLYNRDYALREHIQFLIDSLREAARIMEDHGIRLAIENHCDFTGKELAEILGAVDSPNVGCALDTGNGFTVFYDPHEEVRLLTPFTFTTHIKDMLVVEKKHGVPFDVVGCPLGEGNVDIPWVIDELAANCPNAGGLHLIVEVTWVPPTPDEDRAEVMRDLYRSSVRYLQELLQGAQ